MFQPTNCLWSFHHSFWFFKINIWRSIHFQKIWFSYLFKLRDLSDICTKKIPDSIHFGISHIFVVFFNISRPKISFMKVLTHFNSPFFRMLLLSAVLLSWPKWACSWWFKISAGAGRYVHLNSRSPRFMLLKENIIS